MALASLSVNRVLTVTVTFNHLKNETTNQNELKICIDILETVIFFISEGKKILEKHTDRWRWRECSDIMSMWKHIFDEVQHHYTEVNLHFRIIICSYFNDFLRRKKEESPLKKNIMVVPLASHDGISTKSVCTYSSIAQLFTLQSVILPLFTFLAAK